MHLLLAILFLLASTLAFPSHSATLSFGTPAKINDFLQPIGDVADDFLISPNGKFVLYTADKENDEVYELYLSSIAGGKTTKLNPPLVPGGDVTGNFQFTNDGKMVVYVADQETNGKLELFSVSTSGGEVTKLNGELAPRLNHGVEKFIISGDGNRVVYEADQTNRDGSERQIYSVPINGGNPVRLSKRPEPEGSASVRSFFLASGDNTVVYRAPANIAGVDELFSVSIEGGESTKLNGTIVGTGDVVDFKVSNDGSFVVYLADQFVRRKRELFMVPATGGEAVKVHTEFEDTRTILTNFQLSPNDRYVVYRLDQSIENDHELFSSELNVIEPNLMKISGDNLAGSDVTEFEISPDSNWVVYKANQDPNRTGELYSSEINQASSIALHDGLPISSTIDRVSIASGSERVVFNTGDSLFKNEISSGGLIELKDTSILNDVVFFELSSNGDYVVYLADQDDNGDPEIYAVATEGGSSSALLGSDPINGVYNEYFEISGDGNHVVYLSNLENLSKDELFSVSMIDESFCFPLKNSSGGFSVVCL